MLTSHAQEILDAADGVWRLATKENRTASELERAYQFELKRHDTLVAAALGDVVYSAPIHAPDRLVALSAALNLYEAGLHSLKSQLESV